MLFPEPYFCVSIILTIADKVDMDDEGGSPRPMRVLLVLDMQNDFVGVGNRVSYNSEIVVENVVALLEQGTWDEVIAVKDFHPMGHVSFTDTERGGQFQAHCIQQQFNQTKGARFHSGILNALGKKEKVEVFFKGFFANFDSFSALSYDSDYALKVVRKSLALDVQGMLDAFTGSYQLPLSDPNDLDSDPTGYDEIDDFAFTPGDAFTKNITSLNQRIESIIMHCKSYKRALEIHICGVELDYEVKDAMINLKNLCDEINYDRVEIKIEWEACGTWTQEYGMSNLLNDEDFKRAFEIENNSKSYFKVNAKGTKAILKAKTILKAKAKAKAIAKAEP